MGHRNRGRDGHSGRRFRCDHDFHLVDAQIAEKEGRETMSYLDIIVPHYQEPWETGKKFFDMLGLQRGINFDDIRVILCQDGKEGGRMLPLGIFDGYPYEVRSVVLIEQSGVSAARNAGIQEAKAPWVCFCDFDDMYSSALSMKVALGALHKAEEDGIVYLWNRFMEEVNDETGRTAIYKHDWDATFIHGRFFWRQFIQDNDLRFNENLDFGEDQDFNTIAQIVAGNSRVGEIKEPIYLWCENADSVTRREKDKTVFYSKMLKHRFATAEELERRGIEGEYLGAVVRCAMDVYYEMNADKCRKNVRKCEEQFAAWWLDHRDDFYRAPRDMIASIFTTVRTWAANAGLVTVERITLGEWLEMIERKYGVSEELR